MKKLAKTFLCYTKTLYFALPFTHDCVNYIVVAYPYRKQCQKVVGSSLHFIAQLLFCAFNKQDSKLIRKIYAHIPRTLYYYSASCALLHLCKCPWCALNSLHAALKILLSIINYFFIKQSQQRLMKYI